MVALSEHDDMVSLFFRQSNVLKKIISEFISKYGVSNDSKKEKR